MLVWPRIVDYLFGSKTAGSDSQLKKKAQPVVFDAMILF